MTKTIKLFLPKDFYEELLYQYEGKEGELRALVFSYLKPLGKQGRMVKLNQTIQTRVMKDGKMAMEETDLKEIDFEKTSVKPDSEWIPEKVTKEEIKIYSLTVSEKLYEDLAYFAKVFCARLLIYNDSLDKKSPEYKNQVAVPPTCFEQIIQDNVVNQLSGAVSVNIDKEYDEEFAEMEKTIAEKSKKTLPRSKKK